ncbi:hypothetical protein SAMN04489732_110291 [Amycolatopsis saalfeldensis]|uniref:Uncharacterized protein n=1 Tax=Amycolatopsis saalfeldensis TaxID=394193 RepID=A0A1H8Y3E3_9PSEU|nr:hypothetical protein SAMN04489732_110291 [Amycolatopsis saalfeldensis]
MFTALRSLSDVDYWVRSRCEGLSMPTTVTRCNRRPSVAAATVAIPKAVPQPPFPTLVVRIVEFLR